MPLPSPNYTMIPNILIDQYLTELTGLEFKVLMVIARKTIGWHKRIDIISLSQFEKLTNCCKQQIIESLKSLLKKDLIIKIVEGEKGFQIVRYGLNIEDSSPETKLPQSNNPTTPQSRNVSTPSLETRHTKETLTKEKHACSTQDQSNEEKNRQLFLELKREAPHKCKNLYIYHIGKLANDNTTGLSLSLLMPYKDFERLILENYKLEIKDEQTSR